MDTKNFDTTTDNSCPLCKQFPNLGPRVLAAIDELESGGGQRFDTIEELFASWHTDEDAIIVKSGILPN